MSLVFMSYRHKDSDFATRLLFEQLSKDLGETSVFRDVNTTKHGEDFVISIQKAMDKCHVFLPVIGELWFEEMSSHAHDTDYVQLEIEMALKRAAEPDAPLKIIPVLLHPAVMPPPDRLPPSIAPLSRIFAKKIYQGADFDASYQSLLTSISDALPIDVRKKVARDRPKPSRWSPPLWTFLAFSFAIITICTALALSFAPAAGKQVRHDPRNELLFEDLHRVEDRLRKIDNPPPKQSDIESATVATLGTPDYSSFEIRSDERAWDLRYYSPERIPEAKDNYVSAMISERTINVIKTEECQELRLQHRTVGHDIVFEVSSDLPVHIEEAAQKNAVGTLRTKTEHLCFDVSKIPINQPFIVHYRAAYWDAYEEEEERWLGVMGYPACRQVRVFVISNEPGIFKRLTRKASFSYASEIAPCEDGVILKNDEENAFLWDIQKPTPYKVYMAFF